MMTFFDPMPKRKHRCPTPEVRDAIILSLKGWRCDCGKAYVIEMVSQHGEYWRQWKRSPEHDETT